MKPFSTHTGTAVALWRENIDTDQIIPKDFLKSVRRTGFGVHLFQGWRYLSDGSENPAFELNRPGAREATILVAANNFGCGSSREHAVWALAEYGFRAVIAPAKVCAGRKIPAFADIFRGNALKNGLLTIDLPQETVEKLRAAVAAEPGKPFTIDLKARTVRCAGLIAPFEIEATAREKILHGLDDIALTLQDESAIARFEAERETREAWG